MPINPTNASNIIYGARVSDDSELPLFSEVFPHLIDPDEINYIDTFSRSGAINGSSPEQAASALSWVGHGSIIGDPAGGGAAVNAVTGTNGAAVWLDSGSDGEVLALVEIGELAGLVGVVFRCESHNSNLWRAFINAGGTHNQVGLHCRGPDAPSRTITATLPEPVEVGKTYMVSVKFEGQTVVANIAGVEIALSDAAGHESISGTGIYFQNTAAASAHRVLACYVK